MTLRAVAQDPYIVSPLVESNPNGPQGSRLLLFARFEIGAFAARPVQAAEQQVEPMPQWLVVTALLLARGPQLQDHALERGHVVRQVLGRGRLQIGGTSGDGGLRIRHGVSVQAPRRHDLDGDSWTDRGFGPAV
jgi:hypothetical protein